MLKLLNITSDGIVDKLDLIKMKTYKQKQAFLDAVKTAILGEGATAPLNSELKTIILKNSE